MCIRKKSYKERWDSTLMEFYERKQKQTMISNTTECLMSTWSHFHFYTCTLRKVAFGGKSTLLPYEVVLALINGGVAFMARYPTPWYLYMSVKGKDNLSPGRCGGGKMWSLWLKHLVFGWKNVQFQEMGSLKSLEPSSRLKRDLRKSSGN